MTSETRQNIRTNSNNARAYGICPIGAIIFYASSLTGVPLLNPEWVQCNGQVITDTQSPMYGQTVPNINGSSQFLRASSTSGSTGGATSVAITVTGTGSTSFSASGSLSSATQTVVTSVTGVVDTTTTLNYVPGGSAASVFGSVSVSVTSSGSVATLPPYYTATAIMRIK